MKYDKTIFGTHDSGWNRETVAINEAERLRHIYIIGRTGTGKSTLIENLILQDIEYNCIGIFLVLASF